MRILVACEFSGIVRQAFIEQGHDAWSCDLLPSEQYGPHVQRDVRLILNDGWDMMCCFPPCTYLCNSGARWWNLRQQEQKDAIAFVRSLLDAPIPRIALENPTGCLSTAIRKPDQILQPFLFGENASKATCLWLKNLPKLWPTRVMEAARMRCPSCAVLPVVPFSLLPTDSMAAPAYLADSPGPFMPIKQQAVKTIYPRARLERRTVHGRIQGLPLQWQNNGEQSFHDPALNGVDFRRL